jgi:hypothetical protein
VGAALTTTGRVGTTRRLGSGKQGGKVYESRNQWSNPLKARTGSNLVDMGRIAAHVPALARTTPSPVNRAGQEAMEKVCGVPMARLQGKSWAPHPSNGQQRTWEPPQGRPPRRSDLIEGGQARRRLMAPRWGGVLVVVGGQESWLHGEGGQRVRSCGSGMSGGRR